MKKLLFIVNPRAGKTKSSAPLFDAVAAFSRAGYLVRVFLTEAGGEARTYAAKWGPQYDVVVCAGGDGTLNETISGLMELEHRPLLGYLPNGSTNDFAASLHLPTDLLQAARDIVEGEPCCYDVGKFGNRYFSYVASFGAFTRTSYSTPQNIKNALGHTAYLLDGISELSQIKPLHVRFELENEVIDDDFIFGAISNSTSVGGILTLDPRQVDMSDGKFELLLVRAPRDLVELSECIRALRTQKYNCSMLTFRPASRVTVYADPAMAWTLDGEREEGHDCVEVENLHHAIRLLQRKEPSC